MGDICVGCGLLCRGCLNQTRTCRECVVFGICVGSVLMCFKCVGVSFVCYVGCLYHGFWW